MAELGQNVLAERPRRYGFSRPKKFQIGSLGKTGEAVANQFHIPI